MSVILMVNTWLSALTALMCLAVVLVWMPRITGGCHTLLLAGIVIGFAGAFADNVYWGITWYSKLKQWDTTQWWFDHGPVANIFFRHSMKLAAAVCHLEAARRAGIDSVAELSVAALIGSLFIFGMLCL